MYDLIIIGGGPAGMTAGVYAARKKLNTLLITKEFGGQPMETMDIENYMGYQYITGPELMRKFKEQVKQFELDQIIQKVTEVLPEGDIFTVKTKDNKVYQAKTVIIASGKRSRELGVPGEKRLKGRGVSWCATCDAPLFSGMDVAVIGGGNSALQAVVELSKIAKQVYVVSPEEWIADPIVIDKVKQATNVVPLTGYLTLEIKGEKTVGGIVVKHITTGKTKEIPLQGVFIEIGLIPNSEFASKAARLTEQNEIIVDCSCRTSTKGLFAAGDVTSIPEKQIIVAAGEGAKAALSAYEYLLKK